MYKLVCFPSIMIMSVLNVIALPRHLHSIGNCCDD